MESLKTSSASFSFSEKLKRKVQAGRNYFFSSFLVFLEDGRSTKRTKIWERRLVFCARQVYVSCGLWSWNVWNVCIKFGRNERNLFGCLKSFRLSRTCCLDNVCVIITVDFRSLMYLRWRVWSPIRYCYNNTLSHTFDADDQNAAYWTAKKITQDVKVRL